MPWWITTSRRPILLADGKLAGNWVQQDVLRTLNEQQTTIEQFPLRPKQLAELIDTVRKGRLTTSRAREVFAEMLAGGKSLDETMARWASPPSMNRNWKTSAANCWPPTPKSSPRSRKANPRAWGS